MHWYYVPQCGRHKHTPRQGWVFRDEILTLVDEIRLIVSFLETNTSVNKNSAIVTIR